MKKEKISLYIVPCQRTMNQKATYFNPNKIKYGLKNDNSSKYLVFINKNIKSFKDSLNAMENYYMYVLLPKKNSNKKEFSSTIDVEVAFELMDDYAKKNKNGLEPFENKPILTGVGLAPKGQNNN